MPLTLEAVEFPVVLRPAHPLSDEELLRFGAANKGLHFERNKNGDLVVMTPTGNRTGMKNMYISRILGNWADEDGRGYAFDSSTGFSLPDGSMRSPDAAWVERIRWDALTEEQQDGFSPLCPVFVIELRSGSDGLEDLRAKMNDWIANGAELAWLIDPERKAVEVYRPGAAAGGAGRPQRGVWRGADGRICAGAGEGVGLGRTYRTGLTLLVDSGILRRLSVLLAQTVVETTPMQSSACP